jgi:BirA family biotin operon repressor/biotin-[acetyl-CoA-carboxylase] ligase
MSTSEKVLSFLLNNENFPVSGNYISEKLNISRNAVWKAVNTLREKGYIIEGHTNSGYILKSTSGRISADSIEKKLENDKIRVEHYELLTSTNDFLKEKAEQGESEGLVVIADAQSAGKGRLGRKFESPDKTGIYMSFLLRPQFTIDKSLMITTAASVAVSYAVDQYSDNIKTWIKWVNDVYIGDKKISGILTEASTNFETGMLDYVILGIGINLSPPKGGFEDSIKDIAGTVFNKQCETEMKENIISGVINRFFSIYDKLPETSFLAEYRSKSLLVGKEIGYIRNGIEKRGLVRNIDDSAALIVELKDGKQERLSSGEVTINKDFLKDFKTKENNLL